MKKVDVIQDLDPNIRPKAKTVYFQDFMDELMENDNNSELDIIATEIVKKSPAIKVKK